MADLYASSTVSGYLARRLLNRPPKHLANEGRSAGARISLRPLANLYTISYALLVYGVMSAIMGQGTSLTVGVLLLLLYLLSCVAYDWLRSVTKS